jgi:hypothetical protein
MMLVGCRQIQKAETASILLDPTWTPSVALVYARALFAPERELSPIPFISCTRPYFWLKKPARKPVPAQTIPERHIFRTETPRIAHPDLTLVSGKENISDPSVPEVFCTRGLANGCRAALAILLKKATALIPLFIWWHPVGGAPPYCWIGVAAHATARVHAANSRYPAKLSGVAQWHWAAP